MIILPELGIRVRDVMAFDHERLTVYQRALEFVEVAHTVRRSMPPGCQSLADQLDRSSVSIVLNIAEGAGEFAKREKARFYRIARRSATESAAMLDIVDRLKLAPASDLRTGKSKLQEIVAMLVKLAKTMELTSANRPKAEGGKGETKMVPIPP